ncbi:hypothetical protein DFQ26_004109 [Actinomortierella ambigua]|nr:hypothetical protein DFQ26_004109 [Actinomortierella ambigua]
MAQLLPDTIEVLDPIDEQHPEKHHISLDQKLAQQRTHPSTTFSATEISEIQPADEPHQFEQPQQLQLQELQEHNYSSSTHGPIPSIQPNHRYHSDSHMGLAPFPIADDFLSSLDNTPVTRPPSTAYLYTPRNSFIDPVNTDQPTPVLQSSSPPTALSNSGQSSLSRGSLLRGMRRGHPGSAESSRSGGGSTSSRFLGTGSWFRSGRQSPSDFDWSDSDSEDGRRPAVREHPAISQEGQVLDQISAVSPDADAASSDGSGSGSGALSRAADEKTQVPVDPAPEPIEKSQWLQVEHKKQRRMQQCVSLACIICFIVLGVIIVFIFRDSVFGKKRSTPGNRDKLIPGGGKGGRGTGDTIEAFYGVNKTITPMPGMAKIFYGLDYTPRGSQEPNCHNSFPEIVEDIKAISQLTNRIRLYGMACDQAILVLKAIEYLELPDMRVVLTIWVDHNAQTSWEKQSKAFWDVIDRDVSMLPNQLAPKAFPGALSPAVSRIIGISVGNEVLFRNEDKTKPHEHVPVATLVNYIDEVRRGLALRSHKALKYAKFLAILNNEVSSNSSTSNNNNNNNNDSSSNGNSNGKDNNNNTSNPSFDTPLTDEEFQQMKNVVRDRQTAGDSLFTGMGADLISKARHLADIPVFSSDLGRNAHEIVDVVDVVMSNIHPFFASQLVKNAANWAINNYRNETVEAAKGKPAIISEVGWPSGPASEAWGSAVPSMENMQTFVNDWVCKANKLLVPYYFFEAFDEPWKKSITPREAQWGIMDVERKLKVELPSC